jgi:hypothetical protein
MDETGRVWTGEQVQRRHARVCRSAELYAVDALQRRWGPGGARGTRTVL